ncbi:MAG: DsbA family protein [Gammaproteobacteria bacterium]
MCSWCWAFRPTWAEIVRALPPAIFTQRVLGGLAPDSDDPMPEATREYVQKNWRKIQQVVPNTAFNFGFWTQCRPRRSTYPACRAVIAAMNQDRRYEEAMILAIQQAYYLQARNPSDDDTLTTLAAEIGLNPQHFAQDLNHPATRGALLRQIAFSQRLGAKGFPSLILEHHGGYQKIEFDYNDPSVVLDVLDKM